LVAIFQTGSRIAIDLLSINEELCVATSTKISNAFSFRELLAGRCATRVIHTIDDVFITRGLARTSAFAIHFDLCAICFARVPVSHDVDATNRVDKGNLKTLYFKWVDVLSTWFSTTLFAFLLCLEVILVTATAAIDEMRAGLGEFVEVVATDCSSARTRLSWK